MKRSPLLQMVHLIGGSVTIGLGFVHFGDELSLCRLGFGVYILANVFGQWIEEGL